MLLKSDHLKLEVSIKIFHLMVLLQHISRLHDELDTFLPLDTVFFIAVAFWFLFN